MNCKCNTNIEIAEQNARQHEKIKRKTLFTNPTPRKDEETKFILLMEIYRSDHFSIEKILR